MTWYRHPRVLGIVTFTRRARIIASAALGSIPFPRRKAGKDLDWESGLTVVIPERGRPELLKSCLESLEVALRKVPEQSEVIVVVNGTEPEAYRELVEQHQRIQWIFHIVPLGFSDAIHAGVRRAAHPAVYLLNNDMELEPAALAEAIQWRGPRVFAVTSQILFRNGRRQETGWTTLQYVHGRSRPNHLEPKEALWARGAAYAGGGSGLFHRQTLLKMMARPDPYHPFYWEDVDWSVKAWREGYEIRFCSTSKAWHGHRKTVEKFYEDKEIERVVRRNARVFDLHNPHPDSTLRCAWEMLYELDGISLKELSQPRALKTLMQDRRRNKTAPFRETPIGSAHLQLVQRRVSKRPSVLIVSPFCVLPARHGGAKRTIELARSLREDFAVHLLTDEAELYDFAKDKDEAAIFETIACCGSRPVSGENRLERLLSHAHEEFRQALRCRIELLRPAIVQIEHVELAMLRSVVPPWCSATLMAHDVLLETSTGSTRADNIEREAYKQFDLNVVCSDQDAELARRYGTVLIVPNGATSNQYEPSAKDPHILFVGPFRAVQNESAILWFLRRVYPSLKKQLPDLRLTVVGGAGCNTSTKTSSEFRLPGVSVVEEVDDLAGLHRACTIAINPAFVMRGSSIKVFDSLAQGRCCVTNRIACRGVDPKSPALVLADSAEEWIEKMSMLLFDHEARWRREREQLAQSASLDWSIPGQILNRAYKDLLG